MPEQKETLITGADGYVGSRLARELLRSGTAPLHLWVRADSPDEFATKLDALCTKLGIERPPSASDNCVRLSERVCCSYGNLTADRPFGAIDSAGIGSIVHSAAVTRFNVEEDVAHSVNVQGTRKLMELAQDCPHLSQFLLISSVYASGLQCGEIVEQPLPGDHGFSNHYERSKWQCETDVIASGLPWRIARVATIVSDTTIGEVSQFNAVHNTLKLFYYGMLSIIPGVKDSTLYFVTGDFVTRSLKAILESGENGGIYHVSHTQEESIQLALFVETAYQTFLQDESFKKRRILPPLYCDLDSFMDLSESMVSFGQGIMSQASASISPFARQLFVRKQVSNTRLKQLLPAEATPESKELVERMCQWLAKNKWGRTHVAAN